MCSAAIVVILGVVMRGVVMLGITVLLLKLLPSGSAVSYTIAKHATSPCSPFRPLWTPQQGSKAHLTCSWTTVLMQGNVHVIRIQGNVHVVSVIIVEPIIQPPPLVTRVHVYVSLGWVAGPHAAA